MRRLNNQDSVAVVVTEDADMWAQRGHLLMVADGMGAHAAGELASKLAVDNIPHAYFKLRDLYPPAALRQAIRDANAAIHAKGQSAIGFQGMGTTCSCLVLLPQGALVAHIGDSRVYRLRGEQLSQLTFDHSLVWEMAAAGHMAEEDVPAYIPKNVITRSLGPHETVNIDLEGPYDAAAGDEFLLCSDGLSGQVTDLELGALLHCLTPQEAVQTLVDLANLRGGPDNISVIVARVLGDGDPSSPGPDGADRQSTHPARDGILLRTASIACLATLTLSLLQQWWIAAAVSAAALATAIGLLIAGRNARRVFGSPAGPIGGPYGNGPYRQTRCTPNREVVAGLQELAGRLHQLRDDNRPAIDWTPLEKLDSQADAAAQAGDFCTAVKRYAEALRETMRQIREQGRTVDDHPTVDYRK
jgi:protein phosphatase